MIDLINQAADMLEMPDPKSAQHYSRLAIIDYAHAYRHGGSTDSAYAHLEKAVSLGAYRERIEDHFYRIRQRLIRSVPESD
jgi:hypothetical protein